MSDALPTLEELPDHCPDCGSQVGSLVVALEALDEIACWSEGPVVTGSFDEPGSARQAREALQKLRGGDGRP